jgi:pimeloyl-ACP methyl ester carboxylesterase
MAAILHGVLVGPVAPTQDVRARIEVPTLVLAHRHDLIHPFSDAKRLAEQMPHTPRSSAHGRPSSCACARIG